MRRRRRWGGEATIWCRSMMNESVAESEQHVDAIMEKRIDGRENGYRAARCFTITGNGREALTGEDEAYRRSSADLALIGSTAIVAVIRPGTTIGARMTAAGSTAGLEKMSAFLAGRSGSIGKAQPPVRAAMRSDERAISVRGDDEGSAAILRGRRQGQADTTFSRSRDGPSGTRHAAPEQGPRGSCAHPKVEADPELNGRQMMMVLALR